MSPLMILAGFAQFADLATFAPAAERWGGHMESNPVIAAVYAAAGFPGVALFKGALVIVILLTVNAMEGLGAPGWMTGLVLVIAILVGLLGAVTNVWAASL